LALIVVDSGFSQLLYLYAWDQMIFRASNNPSNRVANFRKEKCGTIVVLLYRNIRDTPKIFLGYCSPSHSMCHFRFLCV